MTRSAAQRARSVSVLPASDVTNHRHRDLVGTGLAWLTCPSAHRAVLVPQRCMVTAVLGRATRLDAAGVVEEAQLALGAGRGRRGAQVVGRCTGSIAGACRDVPVSGPWTSRRRDHGVARRSVGNLVMTDHDTVIIWLGWMPRRTGWRAHDKPQVSVSATHSNARRITTSLPRRRCRARPTCRLATPA